MVINPQKHFESARQALLDRRYSQASILLEELKTASQAKNPQILTLLGLAYEFDNNLDQALLNYELSLKLLPEQKDTNEAVARIYQLQKKPFLAIEANKQEIKLNPNSFIAHNNLGSQLGQLGLIEEGLQELEQALRLNPNNNSVYENILFYHNCSSQITLKDTYKLACKYSDSLYKNHQHYKFQKQDFSNKPLEIAFISADFNRHPCGFFIVPILENLDRQKFKVSCYYNDKKNDDITELCRQASDAWFDIAELNDKELADKIYNNKVAILIDITGFTNKGRMGTLAYKPSPIIISYLGYFATTGIQSIDYHFADSTVVLAEEEKFYSEKIYRFPHSYMHASPYAQLAEIKAAPFLENNYITLGSFSTSRKLNSETLKVWGEILKQLKNARLLIRTQLGNDSQYQSFLENRLIEYGAQKEQIIIKAFVNRENLFDAYNDLDICLDPFPYGGGITTIEALAMGLPVITLYCSKWMGRVGASLLKSIGTGELIAYSQEEYINKVISLANDSEKIISYRKSLRDNLENSPLSMKNYIRDFEKALEETWISYN